MVASESCYVFYNLPWVYIRRKCPVSSLVTVSQGVKEKLSINYFHGGNKENICPVIDLVTVGRVLHLSIIYFMEQTKKALSYHSCDCMSSRR